MNELTIEGYLTELGAKEGTPGGGSATAYIGAMSAALIRMVADIQKDKKKYAEHKESIEDALSKAHKLREVFEQLAKEDAVAFEPVLKAYKLPKGNEEERNARNEAVEKAIKGAARPPITMLVKSHELLDLIEELTKMKMKGTIINDLIVALLFMSTVLETAVLNVTINTKLLSDEETRFQLEEEAQQYLISGKERISRLYEQIHHFLMTDKWAM